MKKILFSGFILLLFVVGIFSFPKISLAFSCDSGDLDTTCYVSTVQNVSGETISGSGNLVIKNGGSLVTDAGTTSTISMGGDIEIRNGGSLNGNFIVTCTNLTIRPGNPGGQINANGKGYGPGQGPGHGNSFCSWGFVNLGGGAGYGGDGGVGWDGGVGEGATSSGSAYGFLVRPSDFGSGGGNAGSDCSSFDIPGGFGGGLIELNVSGTLTINGSITSNGEGTSAPPFGWPSAGGGSGGSIWIIAGTISGNGSITANGGSSGGWSGGGGAGGRIAIYYTTSTFTGNITAYGGSGNQYGAAGTIYIKSNSDPNDGTLIIDNNGNYGEYSYTLGNYTFDDLTIQNGGALYIQSGESITALNDDFDLANGSLIVDGIFTANNIDTLNIGHTFKNNGTSTFSNVTTLNIDGTLTNAGNFNANSITTLTISDGGTLGGFLSLPNMTHLIAGGTLKGTLNAPSLTSLTIPSGSTFTISGEGTLNAPSLTSLTIPSGTTLVNKGNFNATSLSSLTISSGGTLEVNTFSSTTTNFSNLQDLTISGTLTHLPNTNTKENYIELTLTNLTINPGGQINADGKGYASDSGPGHGEFHSSTWEVDGGGAGYGGEGGNGSFASGGSAYGSLTEPEDLGSGGSGHLPYIPGGSGGGAIKLNISGTLIVEGSITANGENAASEYWRECPGGGSGGSIWINAGTITGSGSISANGGNGFIGRDVYGGGGAGGRIAIYYSTSTFTGNITAYGGSGYRYGAAGTIYIKSSSDPNDGTLIIDNNGNYGEYSYTLGNYTFDNLTIQNGGALYIQSGESITALNDNFDLASGSLTNAGNFNAPNITNLTVGGTLTVNTFSPTTTNIPNLQDLTINGTLTHLPNTDTKTNYIELTLTNLTINPGGQINANGKGYGPGQGPGHGYFESFYWGGDNGGGAGYGGEGGNGSSASGGSVYGSLTEPEDLGSGGGGESGMPGGSGGGAIKLNISGTLTINGSITANGGNGSSGAGIYRGAGGGSGGSIWINAGTIIGSGSISANGGNGFIGRESSGGGGGGGRIAIYPLNKNYDFVETMSVTTTGGTGAHNGEDGTIYIAYPPSATNLQVTQGDYCFASCPPIILSWEFNDPNASDTQAAYEVEVYDQEGNLVASSTKVDTSGENIEVGDRDEYVPLGLSFETSYTWRVRVWDNTGFYSDWATSTFTTFSRPPWPDFEWTPPNPTANEVIEFTDKSTFWGSATSVAWDFNNDGIIDSTLSNPTTTYATSGPQTITLTASDTNGTCTTSKTLNISYPPPQWREIPPY